ncbi:hypothetical protein [uncultured Sphingobacterium sp.]|uniref:hypothetical protein n=1 Tax=uncultured Sphingobacterium sp. TaxID=182688 RepID=UPI003749E114
MKRAFLYIDILGFENLARSNSSKIDKIFQIFDSLKVHSHHALQTVVFSDTILVFNKDNDWSTDYYCTYLIEYAQELFYRLSFINVYFKGLLTYGEFNFSQLTNIQAYYGKALIDTYHDEGTLEGFGLYIHKTLTEYVVIFDKTQFTENYDYILLCQSLKNLYDYANGILPVSLEALTETDTFHRVDEDLRFLREIAFIKDNHPIERVRKKYKDVYDIYKRELPLFFDAFEKEGFLPWLINENYTGSFNPFDLLAEKELSQNKK